MQGANLAELPHELWDQITSHIPTAGDLSHLGRTAKSLHNYVEGEGWSIFTRSRFPWSTPSLSSSWKSTARSLSTVSRAWDRRAYVVRNLEPGGHITSFPGGAKIDQWKRPSGQTMGFAPRIDAIERETTTNSATDVLAFSAGAQICLRKQSRKLFAGRKTGEQISWSTYRPLSAREGIDDVTSLHLLVHNDHAETQQEAITGTANGDLQHVSIPFKTGDSTVKTYFTTQGLPVQATALFQESGEPLLSAALGNAQLALYSVDGSQSKIAPSSTLNFRMAQHTHPAFKARSCRVWTTALLSREQLAVGIGMSETPLQLCAVTPTGLHADNVRSFKMLQGDGTSLKASSVFAISPSGNSKQTFLSGAYDGVVRLHDLRAPEDVQASYSVPNNDNAIYSLLMRGQETLLAGTSRHDTIHVFDIRMTSSQYCYLASQQERSEQQSRPYSLFMPKHEPRARGITEGSVYSLAASSTDSPIVYAGLQNTILEMAITEVDHPQPDPLFFKPWPVQKKGIKPYDWNGWKERSIKNVARYEDEVLQTQTDMVTTWHNTHRKALRKGGDGLDIRWWKA